jgi:hypothetical protein
MIIDNNLTFSGSWSNGTWTGQTVTGTGNVTSTNVLDTNPASTGAGANQPLDFGMGENLAIAFGVGTAFAGATSVECQLVSADDAGISTNVQILNSTGAIPIASLTAGKQFSLKVDRSAPYQARRYVAVRYVIVGTGTAGTIIANLVKDYGDAQNQFYKPGFAVL